MFLTLTDNDDSFQLLNEDVDTLRFMEGFLRNIAVMNSIMDELVECVTFPLRYYVKIILLHWMAFDKFRWKLIPTRLNIGSCDFLIRYNCSATMY